MTDQRDPRRQATVGPDATSDDDEATPERDLHPLLGAEAAAMGGMASGFPAAAIANADLLGDDNPAEGPRDDGDDGGGGDTDPRGR